MAQRQILAPLQLVFRDWYKSKRPRDEMKPNLFWSILLANIELLITWVVMKHIRTSRRLKERYKKKKKAEFEGVASHFTLIFIRLNEKERAQEFIRASTLFQKSHFRHNVVLHYCRKLLWNIVNSFFHTVNYFLKLIVNKLVKDCNSVMGC